ncbi:MAG: DnaB-like helicase C-terminal domain-containing protein [Desulfovibrio sp.]|uniref:DnaB-like helicase C-terminal domain-containing protein n=1 Tax=Desulfovibrio sp. 7SRBS1 TaxID=3378064 RepID=UPI003B3DDE46
MTNSYDLDKIIPLIIGYCEIDEAHAATMFDNFTPQHFPENAEHIFRIYKEHFLTTGNLPSRSMLNTLKLSRKARQLTEAFVKVLDEFDFESYPAKEVRRLSRAFLKQQRGLEMKAKLQVAFELDEQGLLNPEEIEAAYENIRDTVSKRLPFSEELVTDFESDLPGLLREVLSPESRKVVKTGFPTIDDALAGGLSESTLTLLASRTHGGKTTTMLNMAFRQVENGHNVLFISLEDTKKYLYYKYLALRSDIPISVINDLKPKNKMQHINKFLDRNKHDETQRGKLIVLDLGEQEFRISDMREVVMDYLEKSIDVVYLDYLGKLTAPAGMNKSTIYEKGKAYAAGLRRLSLETNIPIVTACQTTKESLNKSIVDLDLDCVSESSAITHTADVIGILSGSKDEFKMYENERFIKFVKNRLSCHVDEVMSLYWDSKTLKIFDESERTAWERYGELTGDDREIFDEKAPGRAA